MFEAMRMSLSVPVLAGDRVFGSMNYLNHTPRLNRTDFLSSILSMKHKFNYRYITYIYIPVVRPEHESFLFCGYVGRYNSAVDGTGFVSDLSSAIRDEWKSSLVFFNIESSEQLIFA